ncbi:MAG: PDZ domain-containing protein [Candidatus Aminicenantes bacterium]|nr:PDZ domain-containing protein [Candidatus Aminicenantes bacterium]
MRNKACQMRRKKNDKSKYRKRIDRQNLASFSLGLAFFGFLFSLLALSRLQAVPLGAEDAADVLKKVAPSVVKIEVIDGIRRVATGVIIDRDGSIMTTALISPRREKLIVKTQDGRSFEANFIGFDPLTRLALLQLKDKGLQPIVLAEKVESSAGDWIAVVSFSPEDTPAITQGIISSLSEDRIRLNISVLPGASGSPVVNRKGEMIGLLRGPYVEGGPVIFEFREREVVGSGYVLSRGETPSSGLALAIPIELVRRVAKELKEKGRVERGWLGVSFEEDSQGRVRITLVERTSPAREAGLREGDIIKKINGRDVRNGEFLAREIRNRQPGEMITLEIERDGKLREVKVKLGAYPEEEARRELERWLPSFLRPVPMPPTEKMRIWERRRFIGLYLEEIGPELAEYFGVKEGRALLITRLEPNSPAEKAGLKVGDVIVKADGRRVETIDDLNSIIQRKRKGEKVKLDLVRDKKAIEVEIEVAEEERAFGFEARYWRDFLDDFERSRRELQGRLRRWQEEQSIRVKESWRRISEEVERLKQDIERFKQDYKVRLKESQEKLKEYHEKVRETFCRSYLVG